MGFLGNELELLVRDWDFFLRNFICLQYLLYEYLSSVTGYSSKFHYTFLNGTDCHTQSLKVWAIFLSEVRTFIILTELIQTFLQDISCTT